MTESILVVGGAGYVGSHTCKALHKASFIPVVYDNLSTGYEESVLWGPFEKGDMADEECLAAAIDKYKPVAAMLFAGYIAVGESVADPAKYYRNNVGKTLSLFDTLRANGVSKLVFSSTAAVYGEPDSTPIEETHPLRPTNPYGRTKLMVEQILADYAAAYGFQSTCLRYFNAAGGDPNGQIGECHEPETHLIPLVLDAALGRRANISIFGDDYATPDGTCIRDYVHVNDLASAHLQALSRLLSTSGTIADAFNLGNGNGFSVREVIETAKSVTGRDIPTEIAPRRDGDPAILVSSSHLARTTLGWSPNYSELEKQIADAWTWRQKHFSET